MPSAWYILFLNKRTILDIAFFRFSYENLLSHICLKFERRQFKSLSHNFGASEEYKLTSATSLWLNIAHAHITHAQYHKYCQIQSIILAIPFSWMFWKCVQQIIIIVETMLVQLRQLSGACAHDNLHIHCRPLAMSHIWW